MKEYMLSQRYLIAVAFIIIVLNFVSCSWEESFLDAKPNQSLVVPTTLDDYERLLSNNDIFNRFTDPALGTVSSDEYYVTDDIFNSIETNTDKNAYIWAEEIYHGESIVDNEWLLPYQQVYYANVALEGLENIEVNDINREKYNMIKGMALFFRSWSFYNLVQVFAMPYDPSTSQFDLGIPLKLTSNLNEKVGRATVKECYDQIIADLNEAVNLLPVNSAYKTQPGRWAAYGFLARIHLALAEYDKAIEYAEKYLDINDELMDYNLLNPSIFSIHNTFLVEDAFHSSIINYFIIGRNLASVPETIIDSYHNDDLRKTVLFNNIDGTTYRFKGTYQYNGDIYNGIATDEILLIRAECNARNGNTSMAIDDLNRLLLNRWKSGTTFVPYTAINADEALDLVLFERRKELMFRGLRWTDLRRLNKEDRFKTTLIRIVNGTTYSLPPNDPRYALPLPDKEILLNGLEQNTR